MKRTISSHVRIPKEGAAIVSEAGRLNVPDQPLIPFIEGDGIGCDIMPGARAVLDAAVKKAYGGRRKIAWVELFAGEKAHGLYTEYLPGETIENLKSLKVGIKGPLTTPVCGSIRSLNVALRHTLDLYACVRPVRYFPGVPSPVLHPERVNLVLFRENTEDVYAGLEWPSGSFEAQWLIKQLNDKFKIQIRESSGIGLKPMSPEASKRLIRKAIQYALDHGRKSVTLVHKGNIMKYTEGAFCHWGYELAREEFGDSTISEKDLLRQKSEKIPKGKIMLKDRLADNMFQQILLHPGEYDVIAAPNLNGDYLSDACAGLVGGLGMAPGANIGDEIAVFEATHGTAPDIAGKNIANPSSLILSGTMMLEHLGWNEAAACVMGALEKALREKQVTADLAQDLGSSTHLSTSEFARRLENHIVKGE